MPGEWVAAAAARGRIRLLMLAAACVCQTAGQAAIVLVHDGQPAATIVVADDPLVIPGMRNDPATGKSVALTTAYAAEELQRFIVQATGAKLPIVAAAEARPEQARGQWGTVSNIIFAHGAGLAKEVKDRWPRRRAAMLAYWDYTMPPDGDLPDNLDVMVCQMWSATMNKKPF